MSCHPPPPPAHVNSACCGASIRRIGIGCGCAQLCPGCRATAVRVRIRLIQINPDKQNSGRETSLGLLGLFTAKVPPLRSKFLSPGSLFARSSKCDAHIASSGTRYYASGCSRAGHKSVREMSLRSSGAESWAYLCGVADVFPEHNVAPLRNVPGVLWVGPGVRGIGMKTRWKV
jgi:hypothetical protein